jgi:DNA-binding CsgD family transcriptional regulator
MPQEDQIRSALDAVRASSLTAREREVAELIARGLTNEQIAEQLVVTSGTVANHVAHILAKLGLRSRVEIAVKVATDKGSSDAETILGLLETLREVDSTSARDAMAHATNVLATAFDADKVDAFFYEPRTDMLVALGTSDTPMGRRQHALGLDRLPVSNGGRAAWVFREKRAHREDHVENDGLELPGVRHDLGVRSMLAVPIEVGADQRGVLLVSSGQPEHFIDNQLQLLRFVAYWVGLVARDESATTA